MVEDGLLKRHDGLLSSTTQRWHPLTGGTAVWMFMTVEVVTFGMFLLWHAASWRVQPQVFRESQLLLHPDSATLGTIPPPPRELGGLPGTARLRGTAQPAGCAVDARHRSLRRALLDQPDPGVRPPRWDHPVHQRVLVLVPLPHRAAPAPRHRLHLARLWTPRRPDAPHLGRRRGQLSLGTQPHRPGQGDHRRCRLLRARARVAGLGAALWWGGLWNPRRRPG